MLAFLRESRHCIHKSLRIRGKGVLALPNVNQQELVMKKAFLVSSLLVASMAASQAFAVQYYLESCDYKYIPEYGKSMYVGVYKSSLGNYFTKMFDGYCPSLINQ